MNRKLTLIATLAALVAFAGSLFLTAPEATNASDEIKEQVRKTLKENPDILFEVMRENPVEFMAVIQIAVKEAEKKDAELARLRQQQELEAAFSNPLQPQIRADEAIRGPKDAPLVLVEYSDFQCPFCQRGYNTVMQLMKKYPGKIQFIYKHLPLDFHAEAMPASHYYEALRMQSNELAFKFHDEVFRDISRLKQGEPFMKQVAQQVGADMALLAKTLEEKKDEIHARIQQDMDEARKFGMSGTPGFLINGIPLRGAYPVKEFDKIIAELQKREMAKL